MKTAAGEQQGAGRPVGDHGSKREMVAAATWRVLRDKGLEGASMRTIAREAGCSTGVLLHYFADKEDLLAFAMSLAFERLRDRLRAAADGLDPIEALRAMASVALPIDDDSVLQWTVWLAFLSRSNADADAEVSRQARASADAIRESVRAWISRGQASGSIRAEVDPASAAQRLVIAIDGLSLRARFDPLQYTPERLSQFIDQELDQLAVRSGS